MVVVRFDHYTLDLLLHTDADACRKRGLKGPVNVGGKKLGGYGRMRQCAKGSPEKEASCFSNCRASLGQILIWRKTRQRLNIGNINHSIGRNECVPRTHYRIKSVNSYKESRREWAGHVASSDLSIS